MFRYTGGMEILTPLTPSNLAIDAEIRELAYGLWAGECGRSPSKVSAKLAQAGYSVQPDTISQWAHREQWAAKVEEELIAALPGIMRETAAGLVANGVLAQRLMTKSLHRLEETGEAPSKDALALMVASLDRAGFSPIGRGEPPTNRAGSGGPDRRSIHRWLSQDEIEKLTAIPQ
jgi:hypothetical protein